MKRLICGLTLCLLLFSAGSTPAQEPPKPGKEHKELQKHEGKWKAKVVSGFNAGQTATSEFKTVCNGMWVASDFKMDDGSFSGQGLDTYDAAKKKYVSVWVDSMGGGPLVFEGDWTEPGKTMTMTAKGPGPDGSPVEYTSVTKYPADGKMNFVLSMKSGEANIKLMEIDYTKQ